MKAILVAARLKKKRTAAAGESTLDELWQGYDKASQRLSPIPFHWEARELQHH